MARNKLVLTVIFAVCALSSGAQTLTATYVELADSADRYIRHERWEDAERVIVRALRHEPANKSNYLLWSNLGIVRMNLGNNLGALEAFEIGLASAPRSTQLLTNRARVLMSMGRNDDALTDLNMALSVDSTLQWPRKMRGLLLAAKGDIDAARNDFTRYKEDFGDDATIAETEGDISNMLGLGDEAIARYAEACRLETDDMSLLTKLLVTAHVHNRLEEFEPMLTETVRKHPREPNLYLMRAMLCRKRYETSAMEKNLKLARDLGVDPELYRTVAGESAAKKN